MNNRRTIHSRQSPDLVTFSIKVAGQAIPRNVQVLAIVVQKEVNKIPFAKLVIRDGDPASENFEISNQQHFIPGKEIEILAGYHSDEGTIFKGIITRHSIKIRQEGFSTLNVECKDAVFQMSLYERSAYFTMIKDHEVFSDLVGRYGLENDIESTVPQHGALVQNHVSDWDFIISRAEANGKIVAVENGSIQIKAPDVDQEPALQLVFGATVLDLDAEIDGRWQYDSISSVSWDPSTQELSENESEEKAWDKNGNLSGKDISGQLNIATTDQKHTGFLSSEELQSWSDARLLKSRLSKTRGRVKIQGHAAPKLNNTIQIDGIGERMSGKLWVSGVRHALSEGNWETDIQFGIDPEWYSATRQINSLPAAGLIPGIKGLYIGIVTQLESDPDSEDRIQLKIPAINNDEDGIWARIACLDAGEGRGTFFRPEIGDEVVVGFLQEDPRFPVVLGMLHSSKKPTPQAITNDNHDKGFVSREELKMIFNDEKKSIAFSTPAGKILILDEDDGSIKLEDENGNKITMNSDGITLESAKDIILKASGDVKAEGMNIEQKASASFKAEGGAGAEVSSSASTTIKGSLVQIN